MEQKRMIRNQYNDYTDEVDTIDLLEVARAIVKHLRLIIVLTIVCGTLAFGITSFLIPKEYTSSTTIFLTPMVDQTTGSADYNSQMANSKLVTNVVELLTQNNIMSEVAKDTGLESGQAARNYLTVTNQQDTELITVSATTSNPKLSKKLAEDTVNVFIDEMQDKINVINIEVVDKARLSYEPSGPNVKKNTMFGALLGFLLGIAYAVIRMLMDTRLKNKAEAEKYLGIPVYCELPDLEKYYD